eukprot:gnl/Chilomastix_cuspidata/8344.p1 GENE.gnl/Chilomastix_cuspidata/8344~~gnl/Chilomastix_cuspidata/8344.p1  ORF type:complete len:326 (-),score=94.46 gnl/Chilomastix_cuspidata/8344:113-1090(-)
MGAELSGVRSWDALWFEAIAQHGYSAPQAIAFQPLLPLLVRHWGAGAVVALNGVAAALTLFLTFRVAAALSARTWLDDVSLFLLFSFPQPLPHLCAVYTESLFQLLSTAVVALAVSHAGAWATSCACLAACAAALLRANGFLLGGFVAVRVLRGAAPCNPLVRAALAALLGSLPFWTFRAFLKGACAVLGIDASGALPGYSAVEREFWSVAPFAYWTAANLPRFVLALPAALLWGRCVYATLARAPRELCAAPPWRWRWDVVMAVHAGAVLALAAVTANVEVIPRLMWASSPLVLLSRPRRAEVLVGAGLGVLGVWMFALHYPWT